MTQSTSFANVTEAVRQSLPSYDQGLVAEKLLGRTLGEHLQIIARGRETDDAVVDCRNGVRLTYRAFLERVDQCARGFMASGIERGDRIGIWSTNNADWLVTFLAAARVGAILVNINPGYKSSELEYVLKQSGVKLLVTIPTNRASDYLAILHELAPALFAEGGNHASPNSAVKSSTTVPDLQQIILMNPGNEPHKLASALKSFEQLLVEGESVVSGDLHQRAARLQFDDPINIQYTSGTTGFPKGVTLSHFNLLNNAYLAALAMGVNSQSRFCVPMPFYHCGGMVSSSLATLSVGGAVIIPGPYFEELSVLEAIQAERCTHISGVPTMFIAELEHRDFTKYDLSSMKSGFMAGAPCPVQLMKKVAAEMHIHDLVILYGLTEASPLITATTIDDSLEIRSSTVGRVVAGLEVKIVDTESNEVVPRGAQGELCSRGHGVMLGYWNNPGATREAIDSSGWLHTGDLAVMNEEGYVKITGRKKDMIIRGGENIYPRELEEVLHCHPSVSQAQVFGIPDAKFGEEVALWMTLRAGTTCDAKEITAWLKERVAYFKVPKHVRIVDAFPMTVTGKVQKFAMREIMIKELGLEAVSKIETA